FFFRSSINDSRGFGMRAPRGAGRPRRARTASIPGRSMAAHRQRSDPRNANGAASHPRDAAPCCRRASRQLFEPELLLPEEPPLFEAVLRDELPPDDDLDAVPRDDEPPLLFDPLLFDPLLLDAPLLDAPPRELVPLLLDDDEVLREPRVAALAAAAPSAAPAAAPAAAASGLLRRLVLRCSFSPRPALKPTVVRSGILISVPVRGLRPVRAE